MSAPAVRRAAAVRVHRRIGIELPVTLQRRVLENLLDIGRMMHPREVVGVPQRRLEAAQPTSTPGRAASARLHARDIRRDRIPFHDEGSPAG
jgi:hypothetical protein